MGNTATEQITTLDELMLSAVERRAIVTRSGFIYGPKYSHIPASFVANMPVSVIHNWLKEGMYIYKKKTK